MGVASEDDKNWIVGVDDDEGPPVPIPNTEVKLISAEDTWLVTAWENREMPTQTRGLREGAVLLYSSLAQSVERIRRLQPEKA